MATALLKSSKSIISHKDFYQYILCFLDQLNESSYSILLFDKFLIILYKAPDGPNNCIVPQTCLAKLWILVCWKILSIDKTSIIYKILGDFSWTLAPFVI